MNITGEFALFFKKKNKRQKNPEKFLRLQLIVGKCFCLCLPIFPKRGWRG